MEAIKKLGIIGGMGSRAGSLLFQKIIDYSPALKDQDFVEIILHNNSRVPDRTSAIVHHGASPEAELLRSVKLMNDNDIDFIIIACVTAHYYYDVLQEQSKAHILHPAEVTLVHYLNSYTPSKKLGLLCTTGALQGNIFQKVCKKRKVDLIMLDEFEQEELFMRAVYMEGGLKSAAISEPALKCFAESVHRLSEKGADLFIGGCSEVQVGLANIDVSLPCLDPFDILARRAVDLCYKGY